MKPTDLHVGVIDFFAVFLPGSLLTAFVMLEGEIPGSLDALSRRTEAFGSGGLWFVFLLASYAVGHFVFLISSNLDGLYDAYRRVRWPDKERNAYQTAKRLRDTDLGTAARSMNVFTWAKAVLLFHHPAAARSVERFEADSKFFRSLVLVLLILAVAASLVGSLLLGMTCLVLAGAAFARYSERRYKSTEWAYRYLIAWRLGQATETESHDG